jgi:hypothetical protein
MADAKLAAFEETLKKIAKERHYKNFKLEILPVSSDGANYSSRLYAGRITAPNKPDLKWFGKVAITSEKYRENMPMPLYQLEQYAYTRFMRVFNEIQEKFQVPEEHRLRVPELYGYSAQIPDEVVVLQDLVAEGFSSHDRMQSFQWAYASAAVEQLAVFHALSLALKYYYLEEYDNLVERVKDYAVDDAMRDALEISIRNTVTLIKEENRGKVEKYLENFKELVPKVTAPSLRPTLTHGDFRISNIMHKDDKVRYPLSFSIIN